MVWVAAVNFLVNVMMLAGTGVLAGRRTEPWRVILASILGASWALACIGRAGWWLGEYWSHWVCLWGMGWIVFQQDFRTGAAFFLLALTLEGAAASSLRFGLWQLPVYAAAAQLVLRWAFRPQRRLLPVEIAGTKETVTLKALYDTGNELRDPITGSPVLVVCRSAAARLVGLTEQQLADPLGTLTDSPLPGLRLIPYRAVGTEGGMLLARYFSDVRIGNRRGAGMVAFAPQEFGADYQAIAGGSLC